MVTATAAASGITTIAMTIKICQSVTAAALPSKPRETAWVLTDKYERLPKSIQLFAIM